MVNEAAIILPLFAISGGRLWSTTSAAAMDPAVIFQTVMAATEAAAMFPISRGGAGGRRHVPSKTLEQCDDLVRGAHYFEVALMHVLAADEVD